MCQEPNGVRFAQEPMDFSSTSARVTSGARLHRRGELGRDNRWSSLSGDLSIVRHQQPPDLTDTRHRRYWSSCVPNGQSGETQQFPYRFVAPSRSRGSGLGATPVPQVASGIPARKIRHAGLTRSHTRTSGCECELSVKRSLTDSVGGSSLHVDAVEPVGPEHIHARRAFAPCYGW